MADETRDPDLSRHYRDLPQEEPGEELDAAILAAARRAAETRPAPLVPPTARRRWYFPLAAAAVIVLAVAVTVQVERNQPEVDGLAPPQAPRALPSAKKSKENGPRLQQEAPAKVEVFSRGDAAAERQASGAAAGAPAPAASLAAPQMRALAKVESPEQMLERVVALRHAGRDDEADRLLAEFRKRYPDFRISEEMLKKVERR